MGDIFKYINIYTLNKLYIYIECSKYSLFIEQYIFMIYYLLYLLFIIFVIIIFKFIYFIYYYCYCYKLKFKKMIQI